MTCLFCAEGNRAVDGWHLYPDDDGMSREPCSTDPPRTAPTVTDPSRLKRSELDALLRLGEVLGPVRLDLEGGRDYFA